METVRITSRNTLSVALTCALLSLTAWPLGSGAQTLLEKQVTLGNGSSEAQVVPKPQQGALNNQPPVTSDQYIVGTEDTIMAGDIEAYDPDFDDLTYTLQGNASHGSVSLSSTGRAVYTPDPDFNGIDSFQYQVDDGYGGVATGIIFLEVQPVNDFPVATNDSSVNTNEDTPVTSGNLLANDSDVDGDTLTVQSATAISGSASVVSGGAVTYTPNANFNGSDTVTYTVSDGAGGTDTATFTVSVAPVNDPPVAQNDAQLTTVAQSTVTTGNLLQNDSDVDGDTLVISAVTATSGTALNNNNGTVSYTASSGFFGTATVTYTVSDNNGGTDTATFAVVVNSPNAAPTISSQSFQVNQNASLDAIISASDPDGDLLSYGVLIDVSYGTLTLGSNGSFTYVPNAGFSGSDTFAIEVSDGKGGNAQATFSITIVATNADPVATDDVPLETSANTAITSGGLLLNDSDADGDLLTITDATAPNGSVVINGDGSVTYTPATDFVGEDTVTYTVEDGNGGSATAQFTVVVVGVNAAPVMSDQNFTVAENDVLSAAVVATDADADPLAFNVTIGVSNGTLNFASNGNFTYTANAGYVGTDSFTVEVSDGQGGVATAVMSLTVSNVNDAPLAVNDATLETQENTAITSGGLLLNDSDADGDPLTITDAGATNGTVTINSDGTVTYTPATDFVGEDTVTYTVEDGKGGSATAQFTVLVVGVNAAPVMLDQSFTVDENGVLNASVVATDADGDALTFNVTIAVSNGTLKFASDGTFSYQPNPNFVGIDRFSIEVNDGRGGLDTGVISFEVVAVNAAPVAVNDDTLETEQGISVTSGDLLANDSDPDGTSLEIIAVSALYGQAVDNGDGTITFIPAANFVGEDTVTYTVSDEDEATATASFVVRVVGANAAPLLSGGSFTIDEGQSLDDQISASDPEGDVVQLTVVKDVTNGVLTLLADGQFTYTPALGFSGDDQFIVEASDGNGGIARATITIKVLSLNKAPIANDDADAFTDEDTPVTIGGLLANDSDPDGDSLRIDTASAQNGFVRVELQTLVYTPNANFNGVDVLTYIISDGNGGVDSAQVKVVVNAVNDAPKTADDFGYQTRLDVPITLSDLLDNDFDVDGDNLTLSSASASVGNVAVNTDGTVTYTPPVGYSGAVEITYVVTDGSLTSSAVANLQVLPPNRPPVAVDDRGLVMEAGTTLVLDAILENDSDPDGDAIRLVAATTSAGSVSVDGATSLLLSIPKDTTITSVSVVYTIEDVLGQSATATVSVEVIPDNFAPIANDDEPITINQGDSVTIDVLANDTDADGDSLKIVSATVVEGAVVVNSDGSLSYTSNDVFTGDDVVTYTIDDGRGARDSATVIVTILAVNQEPENEVPSANNDPALTTEFDTPILNIDVLANDTDPDGSVLKVIQASAQYGQVQINADNTLNYTPASGFSGADVVTYTISDGEGGRDSANFTVTVAAGATNAAPRAITDGPFNIGLEETQITFNVLLNDVDPDGDPIDLLNASADKGKLTALPDGTIRYTKPVDFDGSDTVRYTISDGRGGIGNGRATITGPATIENRAPLAAPDGPFTVVEGGRAKDIDVLANDTDADGDRLTVISASASSGTATVSDDNTVDYVAAPGFVGTVTITYEISDGNGGSASSTATVNVVAAKATNTAPVASGATFKVTTDTALVSLLPAATDAELDPVRYVLAIAPKDGIANVDGNGRFTYKPEAGFVGTDTFFFYVTDGQLNSRNYQVTLDIDGDSDGDGYLDSIDQCVNTDPGSKVDNTGCAIEEAEDFDGDGVSNENDNCPSTPAGEEVDANGCSDEQLEEAVEDFRDLEDDVQEVAQVTTVKEETKTLATTVNTGCNASISQGVSSGQQSSLGQACQTLKSGENTSEQIKEAVDEINYEEVSALSDNAIAANANQTKAVGSRMQVVNTGGGGGTVSVNGLNIRYGKQSIPTVALQEAVNAIVGLAAGEGEEGDSFLDFGKLGIFIQGDLDFGDRDTQGNQTGYESDSWNLTIGGDYRFKDNLYGGLAFNFGETEVQYDTRGDESTIENWGMSFYGGWQITEAWYVDGLISYGNSDYSTLRNIEYTLNTGDFQATQRGDTTGTQLSYGINTGYMYSRNGFRFGPVLSFFYSDGTIDGFKEKAVKGSDAWAFDVGEQTIQSTRVSAGLQLDYSWLTDFGVIVPGIRAAYVREKEGSDDTITVRLANGDAFADGSSRFSIQNQKDDEGYYDISVNISGQFVMGVSGFVSYQFYQDYGGYTREGYSIGIRWDKPF